MLQLIHVLTMIMYNLVNTSYVDCKNSSDSKCYTDYCYKKIIVCNNNIFN